MIHSYIALDLETTGLNPKTDKIIEIGAVKVLGGEIADRLEMFVNPHRTLDQRVKELTGIEDRMLEGAPGIEAVIREILDFCGGLPLLGHHIIFDYSFLKHAAVNAGLSFECLGLDTLSLCRSIMPEDEKKNLENACRYFGVEQQGAHRALSDAVSAHLLYQEIKRRLEAGEYGGEPKGFLEKPLIYKVKKAQPASKRQKEVLRDLIKYHKIAVTVQIDYMTRSEVSRMTDKIISQYGRIKRGERDV